MEEISCYLCFAFVIVLCSLWFMMFLQASIFIFGYSLIYAYGINYCCRIYVLIVPILQQPHIGGFGIKGDQLYTKLWFLFRIITTSYRSSDPRKQATAQTPNVLNGCVQTCPGLSGACPAECCLSKSICHDLLHLVLWSVCYAPVYFHEFESRLVAPVYDTL